MFAASAGRAAAVQILLAHGADVSAADDGGGTPLEYAAFNGHAASVQLLERAGAVE
jgi:ankyrin repeat protein